MGEKPPQDETLKMLDRLQKSLDELRSHLVNTTPISAPVVPWEACPDGCYTSRIGDFFIREITEWPELERRLAAGVAGAEGR